MKFSKIYLDYESFIKVKKFIKEVIYEKKRQNKTNINQQSFYFEDYLKTNLKFKSEKNKIVK